MKKNIILFHTDQQRWDSLGCYGNRAARTPNLDNLASRGVLFEHHYCSNPVCMPSRASLFTGRHLLAHWVIDNGIPLDERELTLATVLSEHGYDTYAAGKLHFTPYQRTDPRGSGVGETFELWEAGKLDDWQGPYYGFDKVDLVLGHGEGALNPKWGHYGKWLAENYPDLPNRIGFERAPQPKFRDPDTYRSLVPVEAHYSTYVTQRLIDFLSNASSSRPFFIFAGFNDPHPPFTVPSEYAAIFDGVALPQPSYRPGEHEGKPFHYGLSRRKKLYPKDGGARRAPTGLHLHHMIQNTYGMITLIDDCIGRVLKSLDELGLSENTIVCFTSDHGELLGDHGLVEKGPLPYHSLMRVPFIIYDPDIQPSRVGAPMSNVDVMPTLLELVGLQIPETVQGQSFVPLLKGQKKRIREAAFSCGWSKESAAYRHLSLHSDNWRITYWPEQDDGELYDLNADPNEYENLFHRQEYSQMRDRLLAELFRTYAHSGPLTPHTVACW